MLPDKEYFPILLVFGSVSLIFILYLSFFTPCFEKIDNKKHQKPERERKTHPRTEKLDF